MADGRSERKNRRLFVFERDSKALHEGAISIRSSQRVPIRPVLYVLNPETEDNGSLRSLSFRKADCHSTTYCGTLQCRR